MIQSIIDFLKGLPPELVTVFIAALPVTELRGAIPAAVAMGMSLKEAYFWACLGNLMPVVPLLLYLNPVSKWLRRFRLWKWFFVWLFRRTAARARLIHRFQAVGLALFVMIPLPITGAWTGCAAASLFKFSFRIAFPAITVGVLCAGLIVSLAVKTGLQIFYNGS